MKKNVFFVRMLAMVFCFGFVLAGCDNGTTNGDPTQPTNPIQPTMPPAPTGVTATATSDDSIRISWNAVSDADYLTRYEVYQDNGSSKSLVETVWSGTSYEHTFLTANTTYTYCVKTVKSVVSSDYSESVSATTFELISAPPNTPSGLTASRTTAYVGINVSWDRTRRATGYYLYIATSAAGPYTKVSSLTGGNIFTTTSVSLHGLSPSTTYYLKVSARNSFGESALSSYVYVTTRN